MVVYAGETEMTASTSLYAPGTRPGAIKKPQVSGYDLGL